MEWQLQQRAGSGRIDGLVQGGEFPYKEDGTASREFRKQPVQGTKILFLWMWLIFSPLTGVLNLTQYS